MKIHMTVKTPLGEYTTAPRDGNTEQAKEIEEFLQSVCSRGTHMTIDTEDGRKVYLAVETLRNSVIELVVED
jgi:hypothetical protein